MKKFTLIMIMISGILCACVNDDEPEYESIVNVGDPVPEFSVTLSDGEVFSSSELGDKTTYINFFNTTCPDCQREFPELQRAYEASDPATERYICIAREEDAESIAAYWEEHGLTLPWSAQTDRTIYSLFAKSGIPRTYTVSPEGIIIAMDM